MGDVLVSNLRGILSFTYYLDDAWFNKVDSVISALPQWDNSGRSGSATRSIVNRGENNAYDEVQVDVAYALFEIKANASSASALQPLIVPNSVL